MPFAKLSCYTVLTLEQRHLLTINHCCCQEPSHYPSSFPEFPVKELIHHPSILASILSLSSLLEVRSLFYELDSI